MDTVSIPMSRLPGRASRPGKTRAELILEEAELEEAEQNESPAAPPPRRSPARPDDDIGTLHEIQLDIPEGNENEEGEEEASGSSYSRGSSSSASQAEEQQQTKVESQRPLFRSYRLMERQGAFHNLSRFFVFLRTPFPRSTHSCEHAYDTD